MSSSASSSSQSSSNTAGVQPAERESLWRKVFSRKPKSNAEKQRMEAFLSAIPLDYCGWSDDGVVAYSRGFCQTIGVEMIHRLSDIQAVIHTGDAAVLESEFIELQRRGKNFCIEVSLQKESKTVKVYGQRGHDIKAQVTYDILWVEDITDNAKGGEALEARLAQSDKELNQYKAVMDRLPCPLWMHNANQELIWCNEAYAKAVGTDQEAAVKDQVHLSIKRGKKEGKASAKLMAQKAFKDDVQQEERGRIIIDGDRKEVAAFSFLLRDQNITVGFAHDKTREGELEQEIERYQTANTKLLGQFNTAIAIFAANQKLEFYNSSFAALWGLEEQWLNGCPKIGEVMEKLREMRKLPEQADFRAYKKSWIDMLTSLINPQEDMLHLPDGTALHIMFAPHPLGGLMITFDDVTSRLELESSYNTLIAVQKETLDNLAEGMVVYGSDGRLKLWNPAFCKVWNLQPEDLEAEQHVSVIVDKMKSFFTKDEARWEDVREGLVQHAFGRSEQKDIVIRDDGLHIETSRVALPDGGVMLTYRNITNTVMVERALREKAAALEEAEKLKMDFLANVSYQLRTPLNAIMGFSEILSNEYFGELNDRQKEYSEGIAEAGTRLMRLIDNILDLSTLEAGYLTLDREEVDIFKLLSDIFELTRDWAGKETLHAHLECDENIGFVFADERRLKQVIINLIRNAITFTPGGGDVIIAAHMNEEREEIVIDIKDTGIGIPEEDLSKIFEPFVRSDNDDNPLKQSTPGLGLSLAKNIIELHGGSVSVHSTLGDGATFSVHLPVSKA